MKGAKRLAKRLEDNKTPTATMQEIGPIDAKQCPTCYLIYPQRADALIGERCGNEDFHGIRPPKLRNIKVTIHYGEQGAF